MTKTDSLREALALQTLRELLAEPARREGLAGLAGAAAFFAASAFALVFTVVSLPSPWPS